jgi:phytoene dehydrogenase-like protein
MVLRKGTHTLVLGVQQLPFHLKSGSWDDHKDAWTNKVLEIVFRHAPNLRGHVLGTHTITPLDLERTYGMTGGNIFHGSMIGLEHLFSARTAPGGENYRTPVPGLYLCGAGTHPGGGVTGAPGHNAARRVLADWEGGADKPQRRAVANKTLADQFLDTELGREVGYQVARSRLVRDVTRFFSRVRK